MKLISKVFASMLLSGICLSPALAQNGGGTPPTAQQVVQHCVAHMREVAQRSAGALWNVTHRSVEVIGNIDSEGAPNHAILRAGEAARAIVLRISSAGIGEINISAAGCIEQLRNLGAPPQAIQMIVNARAAALEGIGNATRHSLGAIHRAVFAALDNPPSNTPAAVGSDAVGAASID